MPMHTHTHTHTHRPLVYAGLHGDKDTFRIGFQAVGSLYHQLSQRPMLGGHVEAHTGVFQDVCFVQPDVAPCGVGASGCARPLFLHYCGRHRLDDDVRMRVLPTVCMSACGRPFRLWPYDGRRGYMQGKVIGWDEVVALGGLP